MLRGLQPDEAAAPCLWLDRRRALDGCVRARSLQLPAWHAKRARPQAVLLPARRRLLARLQFARGIVLVLHRHAAPKNSPNLRTRFTSVAIATIFVNQFIASTLNWKEEDLVLEQVTQFPHEQGTTLKIKSSRPALRAIHVRIPSWTTEEAQVKINGRPIEAIADPGSYLSIRQSLAGWRHDQHRAPNETPPGVAARR